MAACGHGSPADGGSSGGTSEGGFACTDAGAPLPWPTPPATLGPASFAPAFFAAYCSAMARCYPMADYLVDECAAALEVPGDFSFEECTEALCGARVAQPEPDVAAEVRAVDAGRLAFDTAAAAACLADPWPLACDPAGLAPLPPALCQAAFVGLVPPNGRCFLDAECDAGVCGLDAGCPGRCQVAGPPVPGVAGSPCDTAHPCTAGESCAEGWCWGGGAAGAPCASEHDCAPGEYCSPSAGMTCQAQRGACESCSENLAAGQDAWSGECAPGLFCAGLVGLADGGATAGVCTTPGGEGSACVAGVTPNWTAGPVTGCLPGLDCVAGSCALPPQSGPCLRDDAPCYIGPSFCLNETLQCLPTTAGDCSRSQCVPGMTCIGTTCVSAAHAASCPEP